MGGQSSDGHRSSRAAGSQEDIFAIERTGQERSYEKGTEKTDRRAASSARSGA